MQKHLLWSWFSDNLDVVEPIQYTDTYCYPACSESTASVCHIKDDTNTSSFQMFVQSQCQLVSNAWNTTGHSHFSDKWLSCIVFAGNLWEQITIIPDFWGTEQTYGNVYYFPQTKTNSRGTERVSGIENSESDVCKVVIKLNIIGTLTRQAQLLG